MLERQLSANYFRQANVVTLIVRVDLYHNIEIIFHAFFYKCLDMTYILTKVLKESMKVISFS